MKQNRMEQFKPETYQLSEKENLQIFNERVEPFLFRGVEQAIQPKLMLVTGQPGAGKTVLLGHMNRQMNIEQPHKNAVIIGDELRVFHPMYDTLMNLNDTHSATFTDHDSGKWVERAVNKASSVRCNTLVEGTMRRPEVTVTTARLFKAQGYTTELNILVVPYAMSKLGILQRYFEQVRDTGVGRFTVTESHDASYRGIPQSLDAVVDAGVIDEINLYRRGDVKIRSFVPRPVLSDEVSALYGQLRNTPLAAGEKTAAAITCTQLEAMAHEFHKEEMLPYIDEVKAVINE